MHRTGPTWGLGFSGHNDLRNFTDNFDFWDLGLLGILLNKIFPEGGKGWDRAMGKSYGLQCYII